MAHNRAQLNALIFHNPIVLPPTSPGYAEMTIAVAELQGGNNAKAALYAEAAVTRDPTLAAGWLAKTAADVFEATPGDLRKERALFCMERALERAPTCRGEIIEFFVANIFGHYIEVLCQGAVQELDQWKKLEAHANELEDRAMRLEWQAVQLHASAMLLEATGLVTGLVALFSRRLGTQVFSGMASVAAFSEAASRTRNAALLDAMSSDLRAAGNALRLEGGEHRAASMLYLIPARDLIGVAAQVLQAEGLPPQSLDRLIHTFTGNFRQVLDCHLQTLLRELGMSISSAIDGTAGLLDSTYRKNSGAVVAKGGYGPYAGLHPVSRATVLWLEQMLPGVKTLAAYQLLATPMPTIGRWLYGFDQGTRFQTLPKRIEAAKGSGDAWGGCLALVTLACLFLVAPLSLVTGAGAVYFLIKSHRRTQARARVRAVFDSLWSADTWLRRSVLDSLGAQQTVGTHGLDGPPPLPPEVQGGQSSAKTSLPPFAVLTVVGAVLLLFFALLLILPSIGSNDKNLSATKKPEVPEVSVAAGDRTKGKPTPEVRRAIPVRSPAAESSSPQAGPPLVLAPAEQLYTVVGVANGDTLNVRAGPGMNNSVTARLPNGTAHIGITGASAMNGTTEWVPIKFGDRTGWVIKQHLRRE